MCRAVVEGGRRCPCTRGDRRRAYQRLRYAARQAATAAVGEHTTATVDDPSSAEPSSLEQRCAETAAAVDEALTALRDADRSGDPDVHEAYLNAVLDHGAVLRDIADQKIERAYAAPHRRDRARALRKVGIGCARWLFGPIHGQGLRRNPPHRTVLLRHGGYHPRPIRGPQRTPQHLPAGTGGLTVADRAQPPKADTEHLALVLGLLASANKRLS